MTLQFEENVKLEENSDSVNINVTINVRINVGILVKLNVKSTEISLLQGGDRSKWIVRTF